MRKTVLLGFVVVTIAMMVGTQSTLAAKPDPVTGIAKGQVTDVYSSDFNVSDEFASGPWNLVLHLGEECEDGEECEATINFIATCQTSVGVVKVSAIGLATWSHDEDTHTVTITGLTFTVKNAGVVKIYTGEIIVSPSELKVNFGSSGPNIKGNVRLFKGVPQN